MQSSGGGGGDTDASPFTSASHVTALQAAARKLDPPRVRFLVRGVWFPCRDHVWSSAARFQSEDDVPSFVERNCALPCNPHDARIACANTVWTTPAQLMCHVAPRLDAVGRPVHSAAVVRAQAAAVAPQLVVQSDTLTPLPPTGGGGKPRERDGWHQQEPPPPVPQHALIAGWVAPRLAAPVHAAPDALSLRGTRALSAMEHILTWTRCAGLCVVRDGALVANVVWHPTQHHNVWHASGIMEHIAPDSLARRCETAGVRVALEPSPEAWRASGRVILQGRQPPHTISDAFVHHVRDMIQTAAATYTLPDVNVPWHRTNAPLVRQDGGTPWPWLFPAGPPSPLTAPPTRCDAVCAFCTDRAFADIPLPTPLDWELGTQAVFLPGPAVPGLDVRRFMQAAAHAAWDTRTARACFRGAPSGTGVTPAQNQRRALCAMQHEALDAALTRGAPCVVAAPGPTYEVHGGARDDGSGAYLPMHQQVTFKYLIYAAGFAASWRFSAIMLSGAVPIVVDPPDTCVGAHLWSMPHFDGPYLTRTSASTVADTATLVRVRADLSNLIETLEWLRSQDAVAQGIASRARERALRVFHPDYMTWYIASVLSEMGQAQQADGVDAAAQGWETQWSAWEHCVSNVPP